MFTCGSLRRDDVNYVIYDAEGAREDQYGYTRGLIWVNARSDMGSRERAVTVRAQRQGERIFSNMHGNKMFCFLSEASNDTPFDRLSHKCPKFHASKN